MYGWLVGGWNVGACQTGRPYHGGGCFLGFWRFLFEEFEGVEGAIFVQQFSGYSLGTNLEKKMEKIEGSSNIFKKNCRDCCLEEKTGPKFSHFLSHTKDKSLGHTPNAGP